MAASTEESLKKLNKADWVGNIIGMQNKMDSFNHELKLCGWNEADETKKVLIYWSEMYLLPKMLIAYYLNAW